MISFLKTLFAPVRPPEKTHDVMKLDGYAVNTIHGYAMEDEGEEDGDCGRPCGGCGCH